MKGENKLILNQETISEAIEYWLNNSVVRSGHQSDVLCVISNRTNDKYTVYLNEKK